MTEIQVSTLVPFHSGTNLKQLAGEWFRLDVANGDARPDTLDTYLNHRDSTCCRYGITFNVEAISD